ADTVVAANKIDRKEGSEGEVEAWELGFPEVYGVSAEHAIGVDDIQSAIATRMSSSFAPAGATEDSSSFASAKATEDSSSFASAKATEDSSSEASAKENLFSEASAKEKEIA